MAQLRPTQSCLHAGWASFRTTVACASSEAGRDCPFLNHPPRSRPVGAGEHDGRRESPWHGPLVDLGHSRPHFVGSGTVLWPPFSLESGKRPDLSPVRLGCRGEFWPVATQRTSRLSRSQGTTTSISSRPVCFPTKSNRVSAYVTSDDEYIAKSMIQGFFRAPHRGSYQRSRSRPSSVAHPSGSSHGAPPLC